MSSRKRDAKRAAMRAASRQADAKRRNRRAAKAHSRRMRELEDAVARLERRLNHIERDQSDAAGQVGEAAVGGLQLLNEAVGAFPHLFPTRHGSDAP